MGYQFSPDDVLACISTPLLCEAEDAVARLDTRARYSPFSRPWMQRLLYREACAAQLYAHGELAIAADLVLFDQHAWSGGPRNDLARAAQTLAAWRRAVSGSARGHLASVETDHLRAADGEHAPELDAFWEDDWQAEERLAAWRRAVAPSRQLPALLAGAVAWDAWEVLQPDQRSPWRGMLNAALVLKARDKTRHCLLPLNSGWRFAPYRRQSTHGLATRLNGFLEWCVSAAEQADKELSQIALADELLRLKLVKRRRNSLLPRLVDYFYATPLVSAPAAAKALGCSWQAVVKMIDALGPSVREATGRDRYRMWTLA